ncbi:YciI family protein [Pelagibius sp.]|uniref:YciI family protein n=1 Tax=Pelagibius sp. TaxID=1931238 RepID=UPI003BB0852C
MLFAVFFEDNTELGKDLRQQHLPAHLAFLEKHKTQVVAAGPLLADGGEAEGGESEGGLWLVEAADRNAVTTLVKEDPFWPTGLRKSYRIAIWKQVFADGRRLV